MGTPQDEQIARVNLKASKISAPKTPSGSSKKANTTSKTKVMNKRFEQNRSTLNMFQKSVAKNSDEPKKKQPKTTPVAKTPAAKKTPAKKVQTPKSASKSASK